MKTYEEIKDIIVNKLGLKDMDAYIKWVAEFDNHDHTKRRLITPEDIELLSPDNVDCNAFWQVADEIFGIDAVCATNYGKLETRNTDVGNRRNLGLARLMGALNFIDEWRFSPTNLLEIGVGYGALKSYIQMNTAFGYCGFDVRPRIVGVYPTDKDGSLPAKYIEQCKGTVQVVVSSNVFQHLSNKQRSRYFKDIYEVMNKDGVFVFNCLVHNIDPATVSAEHKFAVDGRRYLKHYGQFTEIPYYPELVKELREQFHIVYETRRFFDDFVTFSCSKKDLTPPAPPVSENKDLTPAQVPDKVVA